MILSVQWILKLHYSYSVMCFALHACDAGVEVGVGVRVGGREIDREREI